MPTPNRRTYIEQKAREKFRAHASESDPEQLAEMVAVGATFQQAVNCSGDLMSFLLITPQTLQMVCKQLTQKGAHTIDCLHADASMDTHHHA